jgi:hypothetical protein
MRLILLTSAFVVCLFYLACKKNESKGHNSHACTIQCSKSYPHLWFYDFDNNDTVTISKYQKYGSFNNKISDTLYYNNNTDVILNDSFEYQVSWVDTTQKTISLSGITFPNMIETMVDCAIRTCCHPPNVVINGDSTKYFLGYAQCGFRYEIYKHK